MDEGDPLHDTRANGVYWSFIINIYVAKEFLLAGTFCMAIL